ncbi:hypothetical protein QVD17_17421 [Tagetes erecta]|uniref:Uncharacterized protein n=1 Tax=Tagetes erecta TaxID=13708 RepID=A0AAD8P0A6_TARER|nr:hypothetical protein QVD17_17421 [Tagetes erecta]
MVMKRLVKTWRKGAPDCTVDAARKRTASRGFLGFSHYISINHEPQHPTSLVLIKLYKFDVLKMSEMLEEQEEEVVKKNVKVLEELKQAVKRF